ncbi:DNA-binding transcriptional regulator, AcrR family [Amycolatopsis arida]|uniref:DNA-binding transcriptional regulator, AcrR family n=1 Tax=Amycolatopsis arida TaxID=587909 RepID=A0A1I5WS56_9PSEU|nr:TetR/AcrR family transcriptional regulator [Amycolatopsis arida]TDX92413.1 AcrR family transcriptional regulator [Amycolatopsis arida]SFQ22347.1 DNA-binding transcriptional regulator, AcrR family [Amycolatopsis arida]
MPRPRTHDEALRLRLLDRAGELLSAEGAKALSLRRLAADAGTSTTAVYSLFGSKPELVNALYVEGFRRFAMRLRAVERTGEPVADLVRLGLAYRASALADPHLYAVMFTKAVPGFEPNEEAAALARSTLDPLLETVRAGVAAGVLADTEPEVIAGGCWATVHGLVSLELGGTLPAALRDPEAFAAALRATATGWLRRSGD